MRARPPRRLLVVWVLGVTAVAAFAQQAPPADGPRTLRSSATAIVVDVVVRDRAGTPVTDLTAGDFDLFEDDVRQTIGNVTLVGGSAPAAPAGPDPGTSGSSPQTPGSTAPLASGQASVTALLFNPLSPDGRAAANRAARAALTGPVRAGDLIGVFTSDPALRVVQAYTVDRLALRRAIDAATSSATTEGGRARPVRGTIDPSTSPTAGAESAGRAGRDRAVTQADIAAAATPRVQDDGSVRNDPGRLVELLVQRATDRMQESYKEFQRDGAGQNVTASLLALVTSLATLPGRKTVIVFAEELAVPDAVLSRFQAVIDTANRANVAIYAVDTAGLRVHSGRMETAREVAALGRRGVGDEDRDDSQPLTRDLERNEDVLRQDPSAALGLLTRQTGGFLIETTNDLAKGFRRIDADRRWHYLLTYAPANIDFHGEYRKVRVVVRRPRLDVRSRSGYVASPGPATLPQVRAEAAATAALGLKHRPADIAVGGRALLFPRADGTTDVGVLVQLRAGDAGFWMDAAREHYRTDFLILARLVDAHGDMVWKASQAYSLSGPAAGVEQARAGDVLFYRQARLPAGVYTLEFVVHDALTRKAGAGSRAVTIDAVTPATLTASSLVLVRRADTLPRGEQDPENALHVGDLAVSPSLEESWSKAAGRLAFYVRVSTGTPTPVTATLELRWSGLAMATVALQPPQPDAEGRVNLLATVPLDSLPPGPCELRVTVSDGAAAVTRSAAFVLAP